MYEDEAFDKAAREWGTTDNPYDAGYILPDGSLLDMSEGGGEGRTLDHRAVQGILQRDYPRQGAMVEFMSRGAIRMHASPRERALFLDVVRRPTDAQDSTIRRLVPWFEEVRAEITNPDTGYVEVWDHWGDPGGKRLHPRPVIMFLDERGMRGLGARGRADWIIVARDPITGEQVTWETSSHSDARRRAERIRREQWHADTEYGREAVRYQDVRIISKSQGHMLDGLSGFPKVTRSTRKGKKFKVRVCRKIRGEQRCKTIHFGATGYRIKPGTKAGDSYCARSAAQQGADDPFSAAYWSRRMWGCEGKKSVKGKALKVGK